MRLECEALEKAYPSLMLSAQTPALCVDSQRAVGHAVPTPSRYGER